MKRIFDRNSYRPNEEKITVDPHLQYQQREVYKRSYVNKK